ncbi:hypothetical protein SAMN05421831_101176 [Allopseudospirillum japonicum]|uniref:Uncharacterized protein n=1 Tax=Allopseudospirillum japonicum TaxID=64971 RepID=A0A1H6QA41_9GAMM|nr:DUF6482 family protein [Allopseudospirillum japonicum]SEI38706.1 hypothetical protein SAMN05421831_101176 [Allopseudospirillum japonicum]
MHIRELQALQNQGHSLQASILACDSIVYLVQVHCDEQTFYLENKQGEIQTFRSAHAAGQYVYRYLGLQEGQLIYQNCYDEMVGQAGESWFAPWQQTHKVCFAP